MREISQFRSLAMASTDNISIHPQLRITISIHAVVWYFLERQLLIRNSARQGTVLP